jgi:hypothetical protein
MAHRLNKIEQTPKFKSYDWYFNKHSNKYNQCSRSNSNVTLKFKPLKLNDMKTILYNTTTESRSHELHLLYRNSRRVQWSTYRNYKL